MRKRAQFTGSFSPNNQGRENVLREQRTACLLTRRSASLAILAASVLLLARNSDSSDEAQEPAGLGVSRPAGVPRQSTARKALMGLVMCVALQHCKHLLSPTQKDTTAGANEEIDYKTGQNGRACCYSTTIRRAEAGRKGDSIAPRRCSPRSCRLAPPGRRRLKRKKG